MADYQKAEELRKAQKFAEAEPMFAELWAQSRHRNSGWRYTFCLRKQAKFDEALEVGYEVVEHLPDDQWSRNELIWVIYDAKIKPAKEQDDLQGVLAAAQEAVQLGANDLALKLVVFAVIDVGRAANKWDIVASWCDRLDHNTLGQEATQLGDQQIMPDRERWYFARIKAAGELRQWDVARALGLEAQQTFPRRKDFGRWAAKALAELGQIDAAITELLDLLKRGKPEWYLYQDLAVLEEKVGDRKAALRHACEAALAYGDDQAKVNVYGLLARLWLDNGALLPAAQSLALVRQIREREGWAFPANLQQLDAKIRQAFEATSAEPPSIPTDIRGLERTLRDTWQRGVEADIVLTYGVIKRLPPEKDFGFIRREDGGDDVYFKRREAPSSCLIEGQRVAFILEPAFDAKKQLDTFRAAKIRPV